MNRLGTIPYNLLSSILLSEFELQHKQNELNTQNMQDKMKELKNKINDKDSIIKTLQKSIENIKKQENESAQSIKIVQLSRQISRLEEEVILKNESI